jgi:soluble lytic murein transglycosylase-like protein
MKATLIALILQIATQYNIPPYFMVAIAEVESQWDVSAINVNNDGTVDRGLMQLNSSWFTDNRWCEPEINVKHAAMFISMLRSTGLTWWQVAVAYNCGLGNMAEPPNSSIDYAVQVFETWASYDRGFSLYIGR